MRFLPDLNGAVCGVMLFFCSAIHAAQTIPFEYRDGLIWVKVRTDFSSTPLNFLLDSGAGKSVLNLQTAIRLGVGLGAPMKVQCVGAAANAWRVEGFRATLCGISVCHDLLALDLRETSELCSRPIDGLLGQDFFRGRIVQIDFKAGCIRFLNEANASNYCAVVPLKLHRDAMCVPVCINGSKPKWTRLDTGCDDTLHWVGGVDGHYKKTSVQVGEETIRNVRTTTHQSAIFSGEAGLLGNGVLSNYRVTIDAVNRKLLLERS